MELKFWNFHSQKWFIHKFPVSEFRWIIHKYAHRAKNNIFNFNFSYFLDPFPVKVKTVVRQWSFPEFSTTFQGILKQAGTGAVSMTKSVHLLSSKWSLREACHCWTRWCRHYKPPPPSKLVNPGETLKVVNNL